MQLKQMLACRLASMLKDAAISDPTMRMLLGDGNVTVSQLSDLVIQLRTKSGGAVRTFNIKISEPI